MDTKRMLTRLPPFKGERNVITQKQSVGRIMKEIVKAHRDYTGDYDRIAEFFISGSNLATEEKLFDFCKDELYYKIETDKDQTVRNPTAIFVLNEIRGVDCKHYASFIGGVLDALNRSGKMYFDWYYRFASYQADDTTPEHVYVIVIEEDGSETWVDPVLDSFNSRFPFPIFIEDVKPKNMALTRISGVHDRGQVGDPGSYHSTNYGRGNRSPGGCSHGAIGSASSTGSQIMAIAPALAVVPVVGWIAAAGGEVIGLFLKLFGNSYNTSTGVRWLTQLYELFVLGLPTTSDNHVNEANTANAQKWFAYVLGVPMYDRPRFDALRISAAAYLKFPDAANVPPDIAEQAHQRAAALNYGAGQGGWKNSTVAPWLVQSDNQAQGITTVTSVNSQGQIVQNQYQDTAVSNAQNWIKQNPVLAALGGIGVVFLLTKL